MRTSIPRSTELVSAVPSFSCTLLRRRWRMFTAMGSHSFCPPQIRSNLRLRPAQSLSRSKFGTHEVPVTHDHTTLTTTSIIFVHGLRGHPKHTWEGVSSTTSVDISNAKSSGFWPKRKPKAAPQPTNSLPSARCYWPEQLLVQDVPNARVWTYGYNADVIGGLFQASNQNSISQHGRDLAVRLERDIDNEVPSVV